jgi:hypothetical protein
MSAHRLLTDCLLASPHLSACLQAIGATPEQAQEIAALATMVCLRCAQAAEITITQHTDAWDRDDKVYHLRGQRVKLVALKERFDLGKTTVCVAIRRQAKRRRAALRAATDAA